MLLMNCCIRNAFCLNEQQPGVCQVQEAYLQRQMPEAEVREENPGTGGRRPVRLRDVLQHLRGEGVGVVLSAVLLQHPDDLLVPVVA